MDNQEVPGHIYRQALKLVSDPNFSVYIDHNADLGETSWAIIANETDGFWMDAFPSREEAIEFCKERNWKITSISEDRTWYYQ